MRESDPFSVQGGVSNREIFEAPSFLSVCCPLLPRVFSGKRGIRTLGTRKDTTVFETVPIDHSGIFPSRKKRFPPGEPFAMEKSGAYVLVNSTSLPSGNSCFQNCGHAGIRTQGPILKRDVLYRLSYVTPGKYIRSGRCSLAYRLLHPGFTRKGCKGTLFF